MIFKLFTISYIFLLANSYANNLALPCAGCHGPSGNSPGDTIPSINNLEKEYFINAFLDYKSGKRTNYLMRIIANGYSEEEIKILADFYDKKN